MASRSLDDLTDEMRELAVRHQELCLNAGFELLIYCTLRSNDEQTALYAQGRTLPGNIVTNAKAGESAHNPDDNGKSNAYDCVPLSNGKPVWTNTNDNDIALWNKVGTLGESIGLSWAGRWTGKLHEMAHFQSGSWKINFPR